MGNCSESMTKIPDFQIGDFVAWITRPECPRGRTTVWVLHTSVSKKASRAEICGGGSRKQSRSNLCNILVAVAVVAVYNEENNAINTLTAMHQLVLMFQKRGNKNSKIPIQADI